MLSFLNSGTTKTATDSERAFLGLVEGGCQVPIGVHAEVEADNIRIDAIIASLDGSKILKDNVSGPVEEGVALAEALGKRMLANGGQDILKDIL